jgi:UDPglucose 6-dehydrogenase
MKDGKEITLMKICIVGTGYVGLSCAAVFSDLGHHVICVDKNKEKIHQLNKGIIPIYEPGLEDVINKNQSRLQFTENLMEGMENASVIFITVGTPSKPDGSTDVSYIFSAVDEIAQHLNSYKIIIVKSTVPPGTSEQVIQTLLHHGVNPELFDVVSNPEFLREGSALHDMYFPDKIVVGLKKRSEKCLNLLKDLYKNINAPFIVTDLNSAEMIKYASNAFLAAKVSFINEISRICDAYQADVTTVAKTIGLDPRIGDQFLQAGIGYGGSCFPKDIQSLMTAAYAKNIKPYLLEAVKKVNDTQVDIYINKLQAEIQDLSSAKIAVLGISFKPNTDDIRYSRALLFIEKISEQVNAIDVYDPIAKLPKPYLQNVTQSKNLFDAVFQADAVVVATDWDEFKNINWSLLKEKMKGTLIIDGRNFLQPDDINQAGLRYVGVGRL